MSVVSRTAATEHWTDVLCGIAPARTRNAIATIDGWGLPSVNAALGRLDVDAAVAAVLLVEGIHELATAGVDPARLLKKLRTGAFWSTWAEIRVATAIIKISDEALEVVPEHGRTLGAHADWRFTYPGDDSSSSVEVKAVGLSDDEVAFCRRMGPYLTRILPRKAGIVHAHSAVTAESPMLPKHHRRESSRESRRLSRGVPGYPQGLRGSVVVCRFTEDAYRRRVASRVASAVRQLPADDDCWVALLWSNGSPIDSIGEFVDWGSIPEHVRGLLVIGQGVAFPHRNIHVFVTAIPREADADTPQVKSIEGEEMTDLAQLVLERFESSSGVRATHLQVGNFVLLRRDGRERILPFNLLLDVDPELDAEQVALMTR